MKGEYIIRFALCAENTSVGDVEAAWDIIQEVATDVLKSEAEISRKPKILGTVHFETEETTTHCT